MRLQSWTRNALVKEAVPGLESRSEARKGGMKVGRIKVGALFGNVPPTFPRFEASGPCPSFSVVRNTDRNSYGV